MPALAVYKGSQPDLKESKQVYRVYHISWSTEKKGSKTLVHMMRMIVAKANDDSLKIVKRQMLGV